ncbi:MAG: DUF1592 domain-containing protein [Planctomycetales bacterium]|nr:DUF1592 domain-containing protein [Planctomycetales bacterium]
MIRRQFPYFCFLIASALPGLPPCCRGDDVVSPGPRFADAIAPFLKEHCLGCHGDKEPEGGLSFTKYRDSAHIQTDFAVWEKVQRLLLERQMPPPDAKRPTEPQLQQVLAAIDYELGQFDCRGVRQPGRVTLRRLNRVEYNNTIRDLVGVDFQPANDFPADDVGNGFDNIGDVLTIPPLLLEKYLAAAGAVVEQAFAAPELRSRILLHQADASTTQRDATRKNLAAFVRRAYRRRVTEDELSRLVELIRDGRQQGLSETEGLQVALQAVLASPHFLFRVEADPEPDDADGIRELNDHELATRLSYFLWSTLPDQQLFELADRGELQRPETLRAQAVRMLKDPKAEALTRNFAGQWLQLRSLGDIAPDPERFPKFDDGLRQAMRRETELFFATVVRENRSLLEFLNADYSFVNQRLAEHYGMEGVRGDAYQRVQLPAQRRGVLTHGSVLLLTSNPTRTSPVKRGKWILDNILGEPPPAPPAGVEALNEEAEALGSLRERMEQHRANEACAVCHRKMDAIGFGLENFDVTGAWRDRDGRFEIDPGGALPGGDAFKDATELMNILAEKQRGRFYRCLSEKMLTYAVGRGLQSFDRCAVDAILKQLEADDRFETLVGAIVTSDPFRMREARRDP